MILNLRPRNARGAMMAAGLVATLSCAALGGSFGCEGQILEPSNRGLQVELLAPARINFERVADAMQPHCGTLDCHGQIGRNMRLFGGRGLRLASDANPVDGDTTPVEYDATFWSVVGLEPETITAVLTEKGADPERLSLIRKARGHERHKGGTLMNAGDNLDRCLISWLTGAILEDPCRTASMDDPPVPVVAP